MRNFWGKKLVMGLLAGLLVCVLPLAFVACGMKPNRDDTNGGAPDAEIVEEVDTLEDGVNVVLSFAEAEALLAQADAASVQTQAATVRPAALTIEQITKAVAVKILQQVLRNMENAWALSADYEQSSYVAGELQEYSQYWQVLNNAGEMYVLNNEAAFRGEYWEKLENDGWYGYSINKYPDRGPYYNKNVLRKSNYTSVASWWDGKTILALSKFNEDNIADITFKNGYVYFRLAANLYEEGDGEDIAVQEQFLVKNGRIAQELLRSTMDTMVQEVKMTYHYNDDVDLSLLDLPTLPDGVAWTLA